MARSFHVNEEPRFDESIPKKNVYTIVIIPLMISTYKHIHIYICILYTYASLDLFRTTSSAIIAES